MLQREAESFFEAQAHEQNEAVRWTELEAELSKALEELRSKSGDYMKVLSELQFWEQQEQRFVY